MQGSMNNFVGCSTIMLVQRSAAPRIVRASICQTRTFHADITTLGNFGAVVANEKTLIRPVDSFYCFRCIASGKATRS